MECAHWRGRWDSTGLGRSALGALRILGAYPDLAGVTLQAHRAVWWSTECALGTASRTTPHVHRAGDGSWPRVSATICWRMVLLVRRGRPPFKVTSSASTSNSCPSMVGNHRDATRHLRPSHTWNRLRSRHVEPATVPPGTGGEPPWRRHLGNTYVQAEALPSTLAGVSSRGVRVQSGGISPAISVAQRAVVAAVPAS
jgi:hypothetical protein